MRLTIQLEMEDSEDIETGHEVLTVVGANLDRTGREHDREQSRGTAPSEEDDLTEREQVVVQAVGDRRGRSRRLIHQRAVELDGDSFTDPDDTSGERVEVGRLLWDLENRGYVHHDGNRWYPGPNPHSP